MQNTRCKIENDTGTSQHLFTICVDRALDCIGREYPNHPQTLLLDPDDLQSPRVQTPTFFGCFDWHSAVHAHWLLVRMLRFQPDADWAPRAWQALHERLSETNLLTEHRYLSKPGREGFERPYGLAWLLQLAAELRSWSNSRADAMISAIGPLELLGRDRLAEWLTKLTQPIRTGEHSQTAFAMGLAHDWARIARDDEFSRLLAQRASAFHAADRNLPIAFEPSGHDFLSPALAEADLMRRVLPPDEFSKWLATALPMELLESLKPVASADRTDGKLAHLDGLNLSRGWMLASLAEAVDPESGQAAQFRTLAAQHQSAGQAALASNHYAGVHWLGTFYIYGATRTFDSGTEPRSRTR